MSDCDDWFISLGHNMNDIRLIRRCTAPMMVLPHQTEDENCISDIIQITEPEASYLTSGFCLSAI